MEELSTTGLMLELLKPLVTGGGLLFAIIFPALMFVESLLALVVGLFVTPEMEGWVADE
jgi:hypothetical protein